MIVLEGLDGSGKGTQTQLLLEALTTRFEKAGGLGARKITFPDYNSPSSALVKMYLNGEFGSDPQDVNAYTASTFYAVDRFASFQKDWKADYQRGKTILADRYVTSNYIYQMGKLPEGRWENYLSWVEDLEYEKLGLPKPDQVIFLNMPIEISQRLLSQRYHGDEKKKDIHETHLEFLRRCAQCARFAGERLGWSVISCAEGDEPLPVTEIHQRVLSCLKGEKLL